MIALVALLLLRQFAAPVRAQDGTRLTVRPLDRGTPSNTPGTSVAATRAERPPVIDGRDDDPVWRLAPAISKFVEWLPTDGKAPRFRTEAQVAYDRSNLYVFVRCYDPHPDRIMRTLERRDTRTASDMVFVELAPYDDRRTGYAFAVNAAGVKLDEAIYNDDQEDNSWNAVWDVATRIDSIGWTAEFRIPFSQMGYRPGRDHTFGLLIDRDIYRHNERVSWPRFDPAKPGEVSQFGTLTGLVDLAAPQRLEVTPYVEGKDASTIANNSFSRTARSTIGTDVRYRLGPSTTIDGTVNPDFGEVEADPSVLNLTSLETFYDERRPFFVASRGLFQVDVDCSRVICSNEEIFYSRRIGRTPQLWSSFGDTTPPLPTTILGAGKLVGRFPGGFTLGVLGAATERDRTVLNDTLKTVEPATQSAVVRLQHQSRDGGTTAGVILTDLDRSLDPFSAPYLARNALVRGVDFRHRFLGNAWEVSGLAAGSGVTGSRAAIAALQTDAVHNFQRPGAELPLDSSRVRLSGDAEELRVAKVGGDRMTGETAYMRRSAGFEINDLGYLLRADQQTWTTVIAVYDRRRRRWDDGLQWNIGWWQRWTARGLPLERAAATDVKVTFPGNALLFASVTWGQLGTTYDDRGARGGPAIRQDPYVVPLLSLEGDARNAVVPLLTVTDSISGKGRNALLIVSPELDTKLWHRFSSSFGLTWSHNVVDDQWYGNFPSAGGGTSYDFAHLDQRTLSATVRLNLTFTSNLSLQAYAQPFDSRGEYSDVRQLSNTPWAVRYASRYTAYGDTTVTDRPGGFDNSAFQSNLVFRWQYRPGSTLYVVWNEGRQSSLSGADAGGRQVDLRDLSRLHPANTFLVKWSYWVGR